MHTNMLNRLVAASERYLDSLVRQQQLPESVVSAEEVVRQRLQESQAEADRRWNMLMEEVQEQYNRIYNDALRDGLESLLDALDSEGSVSKVDWRKEGF